MIFEWYLNSVFNVFVMLLLRSAFAELAIERAFLRSKYFLVEFVELLY